jgi:hypothetical protein
MSLEGSINNFYRKYKTPLAILVLVFFVYKLFSYYSNVYEGFDGSTPLSAAELRAKAVAMRQHEKEAIELVKSFPEQDSQQAMEVKNTARMLNMAASELEERAIKMESEGDGMRRPVRVP